MTRTKARTHVEIAPPVVDYMVNGNYPTRWEDFIGQDRAKQQLIIAARSARLRGVPLPHTLLAKGSQGIGKTSLALLAAQEAGGHVKMASGQIKAAQARLLFAGMTDGDCLIIDEIHLMVAKSKQDAGWLLPYMTDGVLLGPLGIEEQPKVTIIGCTTDKGRLLETMLDRFKVQPPLSDYNEKQGTRIAEVTALRVFPPPLQCPTRENCRRITVAANNNPRIIRTLLETLRDIVVTGGTSFKGRTGYDLTMTLDWHGLTADGLNETAQRYLLALFEDFSGESAGKASIQDRLQEPGGLDVVERILQDKGLMKKVRMGRTLTQTGIARARSLQGL